MHLIQKTVLAAAICALAACDVSSFSRQAYPDRTEHSFQSADGVHVLSYLCLNGTNAASAHRYVDSAILSAERRITGEDRYSQQYVGGSLATRADINAEIARISREAEAEYRCVLFNRKNTSTPRFFGL